MSLPKLSASTRQVKLFLIIVATLIANGVAAAEDMNDRKEPKGVIGRTFVDGKPIVYKFVNEPPTEKKKKALPWLAVISWKYDGSRNNGMPSNAVNDRMMILEKTLGDNVESTGFCAHAISKTGNSLKELIYYIADREKFTKKLNAALETHRRYPIEITFYHDPRWDEFENTRAKFNKKGKGDTAPSQ